MVFSHPTIPSAESTNEIVMFQSDFDHPTNLHTLVAESWNHAVLDSEASKTVCGSMCLSNYIDILSDLDKSTVTYSHNSIAFWFGDDRQIQTSSMAHFERISVPKEFLLCLMFLISKFQIFHERCKNEYQF